MVIIQHQGKFEEQMNALDSSEQLGKTAFMDLPNEMIVEIFKYLDLSSRLKMRQNKRLDQLELAVKNKWKKINLDFRDDSIVFSRSTEQRGHLRISLRFEILNQALRRYSQNTSVQTIEIVVDETPQSMKSQIIDSLFTFKGDVLLVKSSSKICTLPQINRTHLLTLCRNFKKINLDVDCTSLAAQDLILIRKMILEYKCNVQNFYAIVERGIEKDILSSCFGVTIEEQLKPRRTIISRSTDESIQMYCQKYHPGDLLHYENELESTYTRFARYSFIRFRRNEFLSEFAKSYYERAKFNYVYER